MFHNHANKRYAGMLMFNNVDPIQFHYLTAAHLNHMRGSKWFYIELFNQKKNNK